MGKITIFTAETDNCAPSKVSEVRPRNVQREIIHFYDNMLGAALIATGRVFGLRTNEQLLPWWLAMINVS